MSEGTSEEEQRELNREDEVQSGPLENADPVVAALDPSEVQEGDESGEGDTAYG